MKYILLTPAVILHFIGQRLLFILWFITALIGLPFVLVLTGCKRGHPIDKKFAAFLDRTQAVFAIKESDHSIAFKEFPLDKYYSSISF